MGRRATASMVAEAAGVSRVAVSRAFTPGASIDAGKRDRILKIAAELNYTPDRAARALRTRRSHLIGLVVPDACSPWEAQEIDGLTTVLQEHGFGCVLFKTRTDFELDDAQLRNMRSFNLDSAIVFPECVRPKRLAPYLDRAVPVYIDYMTGPADETLHDRLEVDLRPGLSKAVALVSGYAPSRIAYICGKTESEAEHARREVLRELLAERGLPEPRLLAGDFSYARGHSAALELFRVHGGADVIFAANDESAFGALDAIRYDLGLKVPQDVSVIGFDNISQAAWGAYRLTTVGIDLPARIQSLVRMILERLKHPNARPLCDRITTNLTVRDTVG
ncbi:LacI family DNA-binding transcriptional regulator [Oceanicola granulosus]|nr:substrate-binding domain-containing protein [Oceanicola granulosus]